jgi:hypothetical protein
VCGNFQSFLKGVDEIRSKLLKKENVENLEETENSETSEEDNIDIESEEETEKEKEKENKNKNINNTAQLNSRLVGKKRIMQEIENTENSDENIYVPMDKKSDHVSKRRRLIDDDEESKDKLNTKVKVKSSEEKDLIKCDVCKKMIPYSFLDEHIELHEFELREKDRNIKKETENKKKNEKMKEIEFKEENEIVKKKDKEENEKEITLTKEKKGIVIDSWDEKKDDVNQKKKRKRNELLDEEKNLNNKNSKLIQKRDYEDIISDFKKAAKKKLEVSSKSEIPFLSLKDEENRPCFL